MIWHFGFGYLGFGIFEQVIDLAFKTNPHWPQLEHIQASGEWKKEVPVQKGYEMEYRCSRVSGERKHQ